MELKKISIVKIILSSVISILLWGICQLFSFDVNVFYNFLFMYVLLDLFEVNLRVFTVRLYTSIKDIFGSYGFGGVKGEIDTQREDQELDFVVYFDAPMGSEFQVLMWLPHLKRLNKKFSILVRGYHYYNLFNKLGERVLLCRSISQLEQAHHKHQFKFVFYVNNGMKNTHMVKNGEMTHIQLLHGDSDKPPSYNPVNQMYDFIFVSGKIAKERYRNNQVHIPGYKFRFVSRPQCSQIQVNQSQSFSKGKSKRTILYTTTWSGYDGKSNFTSIYKAESIVSTLLEEGYRVIFRPHSYSYKDFSQSRVIRRITRMLIRENLKLDPELSHVVSGHSKFDSMYDDIIDCMNHADYFLSDVSSTVGDWLYSEKPYILIDTYGHRDQFLRENSLAYGAYYFDLHRGELPVLLNEIQKNDFLRNNRRRLKFDSLTVKGEESPEKLFLQTAQDVLDNFNKSDFLSKILSSQKIQLRDEPELPCEDL